MEWRISICNNNNGWELTDTRHTCTAVVGERNAVAKRSKINKSFIYKCLLEAINNFPHLFRIVMPFTLLMSKWHIRWVAKWHNWFPKFKGSNRDGSSNSIEFQNFHVCNMCAYLLERQYRFASFPIFFKIMFFSL